MSEKEKKPCPFCGSQVIVDLSQLESYPTSLECDLCGAKGPLGFSREEIYEKWNKHWKERSGALKTTEERLLNLKRLLQQQLEKGDVRELRVELEEELEKERMSGDDS